MRRHTLEGFVKGWTPLIDEVQLVLFYEGIFGPIIPSTMSQSQATPRVCKKKLYLGTNPQRLQHFSRIFAMPDESLGESSAKRAFETAHR
jgi:hypothetical protein